MNIKYFFGLLFVGVGIFAAFYFINVDKAVSPVKEDMLISQVGLPKEVEQKRQAIYKAVATENYQALADEAEEDLNYSFGGSIPGGFIKSLKESDSRTDKSIFKIIKVLLNLPYAKQGDIYVWPEVFVKTSNEWTEEDITQMSQLLSKEEIESYKNFGAYAYYRLGITESGKWVYFIAGD